MVESGYSLEDVRFPKAWTYVGMKRVALNQLRHTKLERGSTEPLEWDDGHSKEGHGRKQTRRPYRSNADALEAMLQSEQQAELRQRLCDIVDNILAELPARQRFVVHSLLKGTSPDEIAVQIEGRERRYTN